MRAPFVRTRRAVSAPAPPMVNSLFQVFVTCRSTPSSVVVPPRTRNHVRRRATADSPPSTTSAPLPRNFPSSHRTSGRRAVPRPVKAYVTSFRVPRPSATVSPPRLKASVPPVPSAALASTFFASSTVHPVACISSSVPPVTDTLSGTS